MSLNDKQSALCDDNQTKFSDLKAVISNTTLKKDENNSHTLKLLFVVGEIIEKSKSG